MENRNRKVLDLRHGCTIDEVDVLSCGTIVKIRPNGLNPHNGRRRPHSGRKCAAVLAVGLGIIAAVSLAVAATGAHAEIDCHLSLPVKPEIVMEDPREAEKIELALRRQGYLRDDVPMNYELQDVLHSACEANGIPYHVALGLIETESGFDPDAVSSAGCYGLAQLNPRYFPSGLTPAENIATGMEYLAYQLDRYDGDMAAALTAYNAGHDTGARWYAKAVLEAAEKWRADV